LTAPWNMSIAVVGLGLLYARGLTVLFNIQALKDSQNGFDNSGEAMHGLQMDDRPQLGINLPTTMAD
jgi:hypothetical protein